jgi:tRNA 5-methylaminomethyl-2-thiouridine biosynthesis bifunctional protein
MSADAPTAGLPEDLDGPLAWSEDGQPRSRLYGDLYFSAQDGLAESRAVFLEGCGLPDAWAGRRRFVVGELGFGTGLNILALLDFWRSTKPPAGQLHIFSVEAHPISAQDAARALANWPELSEIAKIFLARWPGRALGVHRVDLPEFSASLDVAVMDVEPALAGWTGRADAWFLDGFAPALNPAMWRDEVLALVGRRSAPGARAATFTVAGQVRRGLAAAGYTVEKKPGFGRKRERLEARLPGAAAEPQAARRIAIVGAGVAGAAAARAVRALGGEAVVIEAHAPGAGGSGNPAALVTPRLDAGLASPAQLFAQAFRRAVAIYEDMPAAIISRGVLQLGDQPRDAERFARIASSNLFEPGTLEVPAGTAALAQHTALVVEPQAILDAWVPEIVHAAVRSLSREGGHWVLLDVDGREICRADAVIVAAAMGSLGLRPELALRPVRGQASFVERFDDAPDAAAWGGYALPTRTGLLFGATHDRDDTGTEIRPADHERNLATLAAARPQLAARLAGVPLEGRASIRATTPDRLPIAGAAPAEGVFILTGFGSRGFSLAPLLAEHVAALALGAPSPLPAPLADLVDPDRFRRRAARRGS